MELLKLSENITKPILGFGCYLMADEECEHSVSCALEFGYRAIDTAEFYKNEAAVGRAIKKSSIKREDIFLTDKIWVSSAGYKKAKEAIDRSLVNLGLDYIDLMLVHQPYGDYYGSWQAMEEAYQEGKLRSLGLSNFYPDRFLDLYTFSNIKPVLNQLEAHVLHQRRDEQQFMLKYGVVMEAWSPFARGKEDMFSNSTLLEIAQSYNKTVAQVILRFFIQKQVSVIPKSSHTDRIKENLELFDFKLSAYDMANIEALDRKATLFMNHQDAEQVEHFFDRFELR